MTYLKVSPVSRCSYIRASTCELWGTQFDLCQVCVINVREEEYKPNSKHWFLGHRETETCGYGDGKLPFFFRNVSGVDFLESISY